MGVEENALELTGLIYDAALASEKWQVFMERLTQVMGTRSALLRENYVNGNVGLYESVGFDPAYVAAYREHFTHVDYFMPLMRNTPIGLPHRGEDAGPWEQQRNSEFYNDYMAPQGVRYVMGCILARDDRYDLLFAMQREAGQPDFSDEDMSLLHLITPHMIRAVHIHHQMAEVTAQKHWALSAMDRLRVGVILLDGQGRPLYLNHAAEHLVSARNGFVVRRDGLALSSAAETNRLRRLITDAATLATGRGSAVGGCLRIRKTENNGTTMQFQVIPLPRGLSERSWEQSVPEGCVAVFVSAGNGPRLSCDRVATMHGLTRAEAKLASMLADGISLEEAAEALRVSILTVRSQLKSVFAKTGVSRQAELVALLLTDMLADQANV